MKAEKTWSVYRHTFPNGKVYIGITNNPESRWDNGMGYAPNQPMFRDIVLYGWRNIAHEILFDGLTEEDAHEKEKELISSYGKSGREKTYNRQYADYERPEPKPNKWLDLEITKETIDKHKWDFSFMSDDWIEPYIQQMGGKYPLNTDFDADGIILNFYYQEDGQFFIHEVLRASYPKQGITFRELYDWLNTGPKMERINVSKSPLTEPMKAAMRGEI